MESSLDAARDDFSRPCFDIISSLPSQFVAASASTWWRHPTTQIPLSQRPRQLCIIAELALLGSVPFQVLHADNIQRFIVRSGQGDLWRRVRSELLDGHGEIMRRDARL